MRGQKSGLLEEAGGCLGDLIKFVLFITIPLACLYGLVRFVKWAWTD